MLALLAKEPSHGYDLRAQIEHALGPLGADFNAGQMYVTLGRLEQAGLVTSTKEAVAADRQERRTYELTAAGRERVADWVTDVAWPRPDLTDFHLKLVVAAAGRLADPLELVSAQRRDAAGWVRPSAPPCPSRPSRTPPCCWRGSCCGSRRISRGWTRASARGAQPGDRGGPGGPSGQALRQG